jgi:integrase
MASVKEGKPVAGYPGLIRKGSRWWLRVVVPKPLRKALGKDQIWRKLNTSDRWEAIQRYFPARAELQALFDQARRANYTPETLRRMVAEWVDRLDRAAAREDFDLYGEDLDGALDELDQHLFELRSGSDVTADAWRVLTSNGWPADLYRIGPITTRFKVPIDPPDVDALTRRALIEHALRRRDRLHRRPAVTYDPAFAAKPVSITLAELIHRHKADKRLSPGKAAEYEALYRMLRELWGSDKPVREIDRADCRQVCELVSHLPPHAAKRWPRLTLRQVAARAREDGISPMDPATANNYLGRLSTLLRWAQREELTDRNPAVSLRVSEPEGDPRYARHPFSLDQLSRIVSHLPETKPHQCWIILLGMFTGARLNEICGLATADIAELEGVPIIHIRPETRTLKTASARRIIPIHPTIRPAFLAYASTIDHERLFPELSLDSRGRFSDSFQKWFSRYLSKVGARAPRTSYHSFRHSFRDRLREAHVSDELVDTLMGWTRRTMRETYGSGPSVHALDEAVSRVEYPGLDLSHPYVR